MIYEAAKTLSVTVSIDAIRIDLLLRQFFALISETYFRAISSAQLLKAKASMPLPLS